MRVKGSYNPSPYEIEVLNGTATLHFYENAVEVNEPDSDGLHGFHGYEFDKYTIERPYDAGLAGRIAADTAAWIAMARREEREALEAGIRAKRTARLAATDWTALEDSSLTPQKKAEYRAYRQALKDVPQREGFPYAPVEWPAEPV